MKCRNLYQVALSLLTLTVLALLWSLYSTASVQTTTMPLSSIRITGVTIEEKIKRTRLLCWVMTTKPNFDKKAKHVKETWGRRCDILLFIGSQGDDQLPVININVTEGRNHLTEKTFASFRYVYKYYVDEADWFLKADDDTYVVVDNLKYYLSDFDTSSSLYMGFNFIGFTPNGYNSGGAGYVLSKGALMRFVDKGTNRKLCQLQNGVEDAAMGKCMHRLGVKLVNTLDEKNRTTFHAYRPLTHLASSDSYLSTKSGYGFRTGVGNISRYPFTFHYLKGEELKLIEFILYHTKHRSNEGTVLP